MILYILFVLTAFCYYLLTRNYAYWKNRGVPGPKPSFLVGNIGKVLIFKESASELYARLYREYKNEDVIGLYRGTTPVLILRDPDLIKQVTLTSFDSFHDNEIFVDRKSDAIVGLCPWALKGEEWKVVKRELKRGFTSEKMKWLFPLMTEECLKMVKFLQKRPEAINGKGHEAKELSHKYTLNNLASCVFGLQKNCFEEENNDFRQLAREYYSPSGWGMFSFLIMMTFPPLSKYLSLRLVVKSVQKKFLILVKETLKYRKENNIVRNDFLQFMDDLKKTCKDHEFTDVHTAAHVGSFFGDGFATSSAGMSLMLLELARNQEVQKKLRSELSSAFEGEKITFEKFESLQYLNAAVYEALRLHPPSSMILRECTKNFVYHRKNHKIPLVIEKGTPVILSLFGLHTDEKYFKKPESYQPERFLGSYKDNLKECVFMPFGAAPRDCLGQPYGLLQLKMAAAYIIYNFELSVNKKTQLPIKYDVMNALTVSVGGLWLDFRKIKRD